MNRKEIDPRTCVYFITQCFVLPILWEMVYGKRNISGTCAPPRGQSIPQYKFHRENFHGKLRKWLSFGSSKFS